MIAMLPSSSLGNEVTFHFLYHLDACGVGSACGEIRGVIVQQVVAQLQMQNGCR